LIRGRRREDASVAVSDQFAFNADGTVVRVVARVDVGVNDPDGLCVITEMLAPAEIARLRYSVSALGCRRDT
jgi:hypothetical protein